MKDQKEIQIALEIWNLINKLSDLLWDRYEEGFLEIYLKEEEDKFLVPSDTRTLQGPWIKRKGNPDSTSPTAPRTEPNLLSPSLPLLTLLCIRSANLSTAHPVGHSIRAQKGYS